jgi:hypothetical protein
VLAPGNSSVPAESAPAAGTDDSDAVHVRALAAGADFITAPHETAFESGVATRAFTTRIRSNLWSFATYRGRP